MLKVSMTGFRTVLLICAGAVAGSAVAREDLLAKEEDIGDDGYNKTYNDPTKSFKDRMKESREVPVVTVSNEKGGLYLGVNGAFGPVYSAEPDSSSGMGLHFGVEPGFVIQGDSWSRLELGVELAMNSFSWTESSAKMTMSPITILPRVGWGSSIGNNLYGVMKLGFGMAMGGQASYKTAATATVPAMSCKTDSATGFLFSGDYDVVYGVGKMQFTGGLGATHHKYSWSSVTCDGTKTDVTSVTNLNFVNLHGGVRIQF